MTDGDDVRITGQERGTTTQQSELEPAKTTKYSAL
jgi:hypothetical protein